MWSYYGAKTNIVDHYPPPKFDKIIEPFAGSARYALKYFDRDVLLLDKYDVIVKIWKWLQQCSPKDILGLPRFLDPGTRIDSLSFDCEEAKLFYGFMMGKASERPRVKVTDRIAVDRPNFINYGLKRIAANLFKIKHWTIIEGDYTDAPFIEATWFIDPPYQHGGSTYPVHDVDYNDLGNWCQDNKGQIIVCENTKADWMEFKPMLSQRGSVRTTTEAIWSNYPTAFDHQQIKLDL